MDETIPYPIQQPKSSVELEVPKIGPHMKSYTKNLSYLVSNITKRWDLPLFSNTWYDLHALQCLSYNNH